jgi:pyruvate dehydrogenase E1 component
VVLRRRRRVRRARDASARWLAGREQLDNLIFVVNCNLQRLDGPVRGNGKIIQELEATFRGAAGTSSRSSGARVGRAAGPRRRRRAAQQDEHHRRRRVPEVRHRVRRLHPRALLRPRPRLRRLVEHLSDDELQALPRGGHDYRKLYAAYKAATEHTGQPTVILAKTVKGWTLGPEIEARNATHQIKKMTKAQLLALRDRLYLQEEIPDEALDADEPPYYRPPKDPSSTST